jgi:hypothetical protein
MGKPVPDDLRAVMRTYYDSLIDFVLEPNFKKILDELYDLPIPERAEFVRNTILDPESLQQRGVEVPDGVLIQRSTFGDGRPTLFVVKRYLPEDYQVAWENVNLTFDVTHSGDDVLQGSDAWREPVPVEVQAALYAMDFTPTMLAAIENDGDAVV